MKEKIKIFSFFLILGLLLAGFSELIYAVNSAESYDKLRWMLKKENAEKFNKSIELQKQLKKAGALLPLVQFYENNIYIDYNQPAGKTGKDVEKLLIEVLRLTATKFPDCETIYLTVYGCNNKECFTATANCSDVRNMVDDDKLFDEKIMMERGEGLVEKEKFQFPIALIIISIVIIVIIIVWLFLKRKNFFLISLKKQHRCIVINISILLNYLFIFAYLNNQT